MTRRPLGKRATGAFCSTAITDGGHSLASAPAEQPRDSCPFSAHLYFFAVVSSAAVQACLVWSRHLPQLDWRVFVTSLSPSHSLVCTSSSAHASLSGSSFGRGGSFSTFDFICRDTPKACIFVVYFTCVYFRPKTPAAQVVAFRPSPNPAAASTTRQRSKLRTERGLSWDLASIGSSGKEKEHNGRSQDGRRGYGAADVSER